MATKKKTQVESVPLAQKLLHRVVDYYHRTCRDEPAVHQFLENCGITDPVLFDVFRIGYSNGSLFRIIPEDGPIIEQLKALGILTAEGDERFSQCVIFPVFDENGQVVNLHGYRTQDVANSEITLPGNGSGVWNLEVLRNQDSILLTPSILDSLALVQAGITNTISVHATLGITEDALKAFRQNHTREILLLFDDENQANAISSQLGRFEHRIAKLPKSPYRYLLKNSPDDLESIVYGSGEEPQPSEQAYREDTEDGFILKICRRKYIIKGIESFPNKLRANIRIEKNKEFHIDTLDLYSAKARKPLIKEIADFYKADREVIGHDMDRIITEVEFFIEKRKQDCGQIFVNIPDKDKREALKFGKQEKLAQQIIEDLAQCGYVGEEVNKLLGYLAMSSRKMDNPLSVMILSGSGAGKTSLQDTILRLCPPEDLVKLTSLTGKALFYKKELSLAHKVLALAEDQGAVDADYAIRNLITSDELTIESTVKDAVTGKLSTMTNVVKCKTSVFKTTTNPETNPETRSRFIILSVDESPQQTRRILDYQRYMETLDGFLEKKQREAIIHKHQNFQRLLQPVMVFNPYAQFLSYIDDRLQVRRDHPKYMAIIKAITFVNQMQRERKQLDDGTEYIEVSLDDIALANEIAHSLLGNTLDELSDPSRRLLELIHAMVDGIAGEMETDKRNITFTRRQIREHIHWSDYQIKTHIRQLVDLEYLGVVHGRKGKQYSYCLYYNGEGRDGSKFLLGLKDVDTLCSEIQALKT